MDNKCHKCHSFLLGKNLGICDHQRERKTCCCCILWVTKPSSTWCVTTVRANTLTTLPLICVLQEMHKSCCKVMLYLFWGQGPKKRSAQANNTSQEREKENWNERAKEKWFKVHLVEQFLIFSQTVEQLLTKLCTQIPGFSLKMSDLLQKNCCSSPREGKKKSP